MPDRSKLSGDRSATSPTSIAVYGIVLIDALSFALVLPYLPFILMNLGQDVRLGGIIITVHAVGAALSAPLLGHLSDRWGRRPVLLATVAASSLAYIGFAASATVAALLASRICAGLAAGNMGILQASLADATSAEQRGRAMSFLTAAWGLGYVLGPILGALMSVDAGQPRGIGLIAAGLSALAVGLVWRISFEGDRTIAAAQFVPAPSLEGAERVSAMLVVQLLLSAAQTGLAAMAGFWANAAFGLTASQVSAMMAGVALSMILTQVVIMPPLFHRFHARGLLTAAVLAAALLSACLFAVSDRLVLLGGTAVLFCTIVAGQSAVATLLSLAAEDGRRGQMMGLAASAGALGRIAGPTAFGFLFYSAGPAAPFAAITCCMAAGIAVGPGARLFSRGRPPIPR